MHRESDGLRHGTNIEFQYWNSKITAISAVAIMRHLILLVVPAVSSWNRGDAGWQTPAPTLESITADSRFNPQFAGDTPVIPTLSLAQKQEKLDEIKELFANPCTMTDDEVSCSFTLSNLPIVSNSHWQDYQNCNFYSFCSVQNQQCVYRACGNNFNNYNPRTLRCEKNYQCTANQYQVNVPSPPYSCESECQVNTETLKCEIPKSNTSVHREVSQFTKPYFRNPKSCQHYCYCNDAGTDCWYAQCPRGTQYIDNECLPDHMCRSLDQAGTVHTVPKWDFGEAITSGHWPYNDDVADLDDLYEDGKWPAGQDFECNKEVCAAPPCSFVCNADSGFWRDINTCNRYCSCSGSSEATSWYMECAVGTVWDKEHQTCNYQAQVDGGKDCVIYNGIIPSPDLDSDDQYDGIEAVDYKCDKPCPSPPCSFKCEKKGTYKDVKDCSRYCQCNGPGELSWYKQCGTKLFWNDGVCDYYANIDHSVCDPDGTQNPDQDQQNTDGVEYDTIEDANCGKTCIIRNGQSECNYICKKEAGLHRSSRDCSRYCHCSGNKFFSTSGFHECNYGTIFDDENQVCAHINNRLIAKAAGKCKYIEKTPPANVPRVDPQNLSPLEMCDSPCKLKASGECSFNCLIHSGFYQDRTDCTRFCRCTGKASQTSYYFQCPKGTVFNEETITCDYPWNTDTSQCDGELPDPVEKTLRGMIHGDETIRPTYQQEKCAVYPKGTFYKKWRIKMKKCDSTNRKQFHRWRFDKTFGHIESRDLIAPDKKWRRCLTWNARFQHLTYHSGKTREAIYIHTCNQPKFGDSQMWKLRPDGLLQPKGKNEYCVYTAQDQGMGAFDEFLYIGKCPNMHYAHPIDELKRCKMRACDRRPCGDGAYCLQDAKDIDKYSCQCPRGLAWRGPGYYGDNTQGRCEYITCSTSPCGDNGICYSRVSSHAGEMFDGEWSPQAKKSYEDRYICVCHADYSGVNCEIRCGSHQDCPGPPLYTQVEREKDEAKKIVADETSTDAETTPTAHGGEEPFPEYIPKVYHPFAFQDEQYYKINHLGRQCERDLVKTVDDEMLEPPLRAMSTILDSKLPSFIEFEIDSSNLTRLALNEETMPKLGDYYFVDRDITIGIGPASMTEYTGSVFQPRRDKFKGWHSPSMHTGFIRDKDTEELIYDNVTPRSFSLRYANGEREWNWGQVDDAIGCRTNETKEECWQENHVITSEVASVTMLWVPETLTLYIKENREKYNTRTLQADMTDDPDKKTWKIVLDTPPPHGFAWFFKIDSPYTKLRILHASTIVDINDDDADKGIRIQNARKFHIQDVLLSGDNTTLSGKYRTVTDSITDPDTFRRLDYDDIYSFYNLNGHDDLARVMYMDALTDVHYVRYEISGKVKFVGRHPYDYAFGIGPHDSFGYPANRIQVMSKQTYKGWVTPISYTGFEYSPQSYDGMTQQSFSIAYSGMKRQYYHGNRIPEKYARACKCEPLDEKERNIACETSADFMKCMRRYREIRDTVTTVSMIFDARSGMLVVYENNLKLDEFQLQPDQAMKWTWFFLIKDVDVKVRVVAASGITQQMKDDYADRNAQYGYWHERTDGNDKRITCDPRCEMCCDLTRGTCRGGTPDTDFYTRPKPDEMRVLDNLLEPLIMNYNHVRMQCNVLYDEADWRTFNDSSQFWDLETSEWKSDNALEALVLSEKSRKMDGWNLDEFDRRISGTCSYHSFSRPNYQIERTWASPMPESIDNQTTTYPLYWRFEEPYVNNYSPEEQALCNNDCVSYKPLKWYWDNSLMDSIQQHSEQTVQSLFQATTPQRNQVMGSMFIKIKPIVDCKHVVHTDSSMAAGTEIFKAGRKYRFKIKRTAYYNLKTGINACEGVIIGVKELNFEDKLPQRSVFDMSRNYYYDDNGKIITRDFIQFTPYRGEITTSPPSLQFGGDGCRRWYGVDTRCKSSCGDVEMIVDMTSDIHTVEFSHMGLTYRVDSTFKGAHKSLWGFHMFLVTNGQEFTVEQLHETPTIAYDPPSNITDIYRCNGETTNGCKSCCDLNRGTCANNGQFWAPSSVDQQDQSNALTATHKACDCFQGQRPLTLDDCLNEQPCHQTTTVLSWEDSDALSKHAMSTNLGWDSLYRFINPLTPCKTQMNTAKNAAAVSSKLLRNTVYHLRQRRTAWAEVAPEPGPSAQRINHNVPGCEHFEFGFTNDNLWSKEFSGWNVSLDTQGNGYTDGGVKTIPVIRCSTDTTNSLRCPPHDRVCDEVEIIIGTNYRDGKAIIMYRHDPSKSKPENDEWRAQRIADWVVIEDVDLIGMRLYIITGGAEMLIYQQGTPPDTSIDMTSFSGYAGINVTTYQENYAGGFAPFNLYESTYDVMSSYSYKTPPPLSTVPGFAYSGYSVYEPERCYLADNGWGLFPPDFDAPESLINDLNYDSDLDSDDPNICIVRCRTQGEFYAGVGGGNGSTKKCLCGNKYGSYGTSGVWDINMRWISATCDAVCDEGWRESGGNGCGGQYANSVYATADYKGCYTYGTNTTGNFQDAPTTFDQITKFAYFPKPERCIKTCEEAGYKYAAISMGTDCYCDNDYNDYDSTGNDPNKCYTACWDNKIWTSGTYENNCGGKETNVREVYATSINETSSVTNDFMINAVGCYYSKTAMVGGRVIYEAGSTTLERVFRPKMLSELTFAGTKPEKCFKYCESKPAMSPYQYYGLSDGTKCFCFTAGSLEVFVDKYEDDMWSDGSPCYDHCDENSDKCGSATDTSIMVYESS